MTPEGAASSRWYQDAVVYQVHVRAFMDSDADGIGDFRGLAQKLDYLRDLGVTAIWCLPFYPSPLKDDGYDIADYDGVNPSYGDLDDFKRFLDQAHARGLRVITELVINHTSDQHPWFQRARRAPPGSPERDFYVWSDTPERYPGVRIIFKDFEPSNWSWDPVARAYFWHRFYAHQPDLNFDNPAVHEAVFAAMDHWLGMGVDGLRLDAVPYLYEREGTNCENLPETHAFLRALRRRVDERHPGRMLLAEANMWPEDAVAYFGDGDECHMAFHFPVMPRLYMALRMEDRFPIVDILQQTPPIPEGCQWATFLRNHDELTLEMVTDEERDYMYRVYAHDRQARINLGIRRRLAPLLGNDRRRIELMNALLFSLPGTPVVYYGDEIGMGDNIYLGDRNGVRTPMQWSADRNAGFSRATPQKLFYPVIIDPEYHYEAVNVESQLGNPHSLLWWMRRLVALRRRHPAFGRGALQFVRARNPKVLAFVRDDGAERILVVANLSRFAQSVELELPEDAGSEVRELFGGTRLGTVATEPYRLTLGPHGFYWMQLVPARSREPGAGPADVTLRAAGAWTDALEDPALPQALARWLPERRWFGGKSRVLRDVSPSGWIPLRGGAVDLALALLRVDYAEGEPETYLVPLGVRAPDPSGAPDVVARVEMPSGEVLELADAAGVPGLSSLLLDLVARGERVAGQGAAIVGSPTSRFGDLAGPAPGSLEPRLMGREQSNTSVALGDRLVLKLFRRIDAAGTNPDLELGRFLTERRGFAHVPQTAGALELDAGRGERATLGIVQQLVPNQGDAWRLTLDALRRYYDRCVTAGRDLPDDRVRRPVEAPATLPSEAYETLGTYAQWAEQLGRRTAELHVALASEPADPALAPEPFSLLYQRSVYQSMRTQARRAFDLLRESASVPGPLRPAVDELLSREEVLLDRLRAITHEVVDTTRIRIHGDYHLGQVLFTGNDFVILDFEGEPARPLGERRIKRSPLRDVAGMLRSFDYAAHAALGALRAEGLPSSRDALDACARRWTRWASAAFVSSWLATARGASFLPAREDHVQLLLETFLIEKATYELSYELNNRPRWLEIPVRGLLELVGGGGAP